ncbi:hypothetical protein BT96DRAFT_1009571 [Gymnopus androsaceus JB14]|uniref:Uncharacterized protein n=1 Tax=Gymnopus androsaceus JB14 TaxID=1447944 RepID=A0A6A4GCA4_9AGAR|nr:hypothetical protein BT96DRAFT_1009571 [Gymnopus androsaceus JB14]
MLYRASSGFCVFDTSGIRIVTPSSLDTRSRLKPRESKSVQLDSANLGSSSIIIRRTRPPQRKVTTWSTPYMLQDSPYANYVDTNTQHLHCPPPLPPNDNPEDNTLFVLVNTDIEADIRARCPPEVACGMPPLLQCLTIWIWKDSVREWQSIQYGDVQLIQGEELALDLGGKSGIEPRWVLYGSLAKKG